MAGQVRQAQRGRPALARAEHLSRATQPQVLLADAKAVLGGAQHFEPRARPAAVSGSS